jgi:hypothetical protein
MWGACVWVSGEKSESVEGSFSSVSGEALSLQHTVTVDVPNVLSGQNGGHSATTYDMRGGHAREKAVVDH